MTSTPVKSPGILQSALRFELCNIPMIRLELRNLGKITQAYSALLASPWGSITLTRLSPGEGSPRPPPVLGHIYKLSPL